MQDAHSTFSNKINTHRGDRMAKQIIVTKDNYGIEIIASLVNKNKESVDITGQIV